MSRFLRWLALFLIAGLIARPSLAETPLAQIERALWVASREQWRHTLPAPPVPHYLTGGVLHMPDPDARSMRDVPEVAAQLRIGVPERADLMRFVRGPVLNQGFVPSCVAHAMAHTKSIHEQVESGRWIVFDAPRMHSETGPQDQGRWPGDILNVVQGRGMPVSGAETRFKVRSYATAPTASPAVWAETIKAAIAAERPVMICYLLPSNYSGESSGSMTSGYHETVVVGYRPEPAPLGSLLMMNSWGSGWGGGSTAPPGFGWVSVAYLSQSAFQNGYVIAHLVEDEGGPAPQPEPQPQPQPQPQPTPVTVVTITGTVDGGGLEFLKEGMVLQATGGGFSGQVTLTRVLREQKPSPNPQPNPQPQPEPQPIGDLVIELSRPAAGWVDLRVRDGERYIHATVTLIGQSKLSSVYNSRVIPARFYIGQQAGLTATARALSGTKTGRLLIP